MGNGPLKGVRVIEVAGIGPGPFCGMMLSDMGAEVVSVERAGAMVNPRDPLQRNRHRLTLDLKNPDGLAVLLALVDHADVLFEGFRPGVAERLGFGPEVCLARNPSLVYGRMTGWGQDGPLAQAAGHDLNYISLSGALQAIGRPGEKPVVPLNLVGDFGGGGMLLAFGIVCAVLEARSSGKGQVVDAAMVDGAVTLMAMFIGMKSLGMSCDAPGTHFLSGAAHYYDTYETRDGKFISIGPLEQQFYQLLVDKVGLDRERFGTAQMLTARGMNPAVWAELKAELATVFRQKTRDEWCALLEGTDACFAPVLSLSEAPSHPHLQARGTFVEVGGVPQNAPAPRFSRTPPSTPQPARNDPEATATLLAGWGVAGEVLRLAARAPGA
jgi:alpha-methylacyl-CoA racemase